MNSSLDSDGSRRMPAIDAGAFIANFRNLDSTKFRKVIRGKHNITLQQKKYMIGVLTILNLGLIGATVAQDHTTRVQDMRTIESILSPQPAKSRVVKPVDEPVAIVAEVKSVEVTPTPTPAPTPKPTTAVAGVSASRVTGTKTDWMRAAGIPENVWSCVDALVAIESGWRITASNPSSGAYGLPQALPGHKMASAGADWQYNPVTQLKWMSGYVVKYGGFCGALTFQRSNGWY